MTKKVCVITGSRAEYGILRPLLGEIQSRPELSLQLIVTGSHLSKDFGFTFREIEKDGFSADRKIDIKVTNDTPVGISRSMGLAATGIAMALAELEPALVVILGDRYEIFSAAAAALVARIPLAHIHGGERSEGAIDDSFRHAITKMSHLHFTAAEEYRRRVIQMGEHPSRVFNVGALALDSIAGMPLINKTALEESLGFDLRKKTVLATYHPVTLEKDTSEAHIMNLLKAIEKWTEGACIFTYANADTNGRIINRRINEYVHRNRSRALVVPSLGQLRYFSLLRCVDAVIGNSSSGIIEAPSFHIPTVNIGDRQNGRIRASSVIDCAPDAKSIYSALQKALSPEFRKKLESVKNPYGSGGVAVKIADVIARFVLSGEEATVKKTFFDLPTGIQTRGIKVHQKSGRL